VANLTARVIALEKEQQVQLKRFAEIQAQLDQALILLKRVVSSASGRETGRETIR